VGPLMLAVSFQRSALGIHATVVQVWLKAEG